MSGAAGDYERLVHAAGYAVLPDWTILGVRGGDRATFLHNLCTNDVRRLSPGQGCEAFFTDVKGHVLAHAILLCRGDDIVLWTVPGQAARLTAHLEKYVIREDVQIQDLSTEARLVAIAGRRWASLVGEGRAKELDQPLSHAAAPGVDALVARCPWFGTDAAVVQCEFASFGGLKEVLERDGAAACDPAATEVLRLEAGTPYYGVDFDAANFPQEVNRDAAAISFTKGCYLGQETVARIDALGHVNNLLVRVQFGGNEIPAVGTKLLAADREVGQVTSAVWSPRREAPLALAWVRRGHHVPGTELGSVAGRARVTEP